MHAWFGSHESSGFSFKALAPAPRFLADHVPCCMCLLPRAVHQLFPEPEDDDEEEEEEDEGMGANEEMGEDQGSVGGA